MYCLHCGDCCLRMSPISSPSPCPHLIEKFPKLHEDTIKFVEQGIIKPVPYYFCTIYEKRPEQCQNHRFPAEFCPIGIDVLGIQSLEQIRERIDVGYEMIKRGVNNVKINHLKYNNLSISKPINNIKT